jgi:hypothetical protein
VQQAILGRLAPTGLSTVQYAFDYCTLQVRICDCLTLYEGIDRR